jgi:hypothetical protein
VFEARRRRPARCDPTCPHQQTERTVSPSSVVSMARIRLSLSSTSLPRRRHETSPGLPSLVTLQPIAALGRVVRPPRRGTRAQRSTSRRGRRCRVPGGRPYGG